MLALLLLLSLPTGEADGPVPALIQQLGSRTYSEREQATAALRAQGRVAFGPLQEALKAADPEVRDRAEAILAEVQLAELVEPMRLRLEYENRPLGEVLADLSRKGPVALEVSPEVDLKRRITLMAEHPVAFWDVLERLGTASGLREEGDSTIRLVGADPATGTLPLTLTATDPASPPCPTATAGKFRIRLLSAVERPFGSGLGGFRGRNRLHDLDPLMPTAVCSLEVAVEPGATIAQSGPAQIIEALDGRGDAVAAMLEERAEWGWRNARMSRSAPVEAERVVVALQLAMDPSRKLVRLRGSVPVTVTKLKDPPREVILAEAIGQTIETEDATITIAAFDHDEFRRSARLELVTRFKGPEGDDPQAVLSRFEGAWPWLKIVDEAGNPTLGERRGWQPRGDAMVWVWSFRNTHRPPIKLLIRDALRTTATVPFAFEGDDLLAELR